ncbi:MAG: IS110 family transposase [bacterium]|nr:IS110 family transposase [bacterium]
MALRSAHRAVVFEDAIPVGKAFRVPRTKAGFDELERRSVATPGQPCEVVMEPTGLAWLVVAAEMRRRGHKVFVPKGQKTAALRKFYKTFTKTDSIDAKAQALIRHVDPTGVHELLPPTPGETSLRLFIKQRARVVEECANSKNRLHGWLVLANPHLSEAFGSHMFSKIGRAFVRRYFDPFKATQYGKVRLEAFWKRNMHGRFNEKLFDAVFGACEKTAELYAELRRAEALPFSYDELQQLFAMELDRLEFLDAQVSDFDKTIARLYAAADPERLLEKQVPGCGAITAAAIEAYAGSVQRFDNIKAFAAFFGMVPRSKITGDKPCAGQRLTKGGPNLLKKYMFLAADTARRCDPELAATYARAVAAGKHHFVALVIVAHKLIRKIYALLKLRADAKDATYRLVDPDGATLTRQQARHHVAERFPSKAKQSKQKRATQDDRTKTATAAPQLSGSPEDATTESTTVTATTSLTPTPRERKHAKRAQKNVASPARLTLEQT